MKFIEYGNHTKPTVIIIKRNSIEKSPSDIRLISLQDNYHLVFPVLEESENKESIITYIREQCHNHIYALCGYSDGWKILEQIIQVRDIAIDKIIIESADCKPGTVLASAI